MTELSIFNGKPAVEVLHDMKCDSLTQTITVIVTEKSTNCNCNYN